VKNREVSTNEGIFRTISRSFGILNKIEKIKIYFVILIQITLGFLDLLGVALIGLIGSMAVNGIQSRPPGTRISKILDFIGLENLSFQNQVATLGVLAATVLVSRTLVSMYFTKRILHFLAKRAAFTSNKLVTLVLNSPILTIQKRSRQETLYATTEGVNMVLISVIGTVIGVVSDIFLLILLSVGLFLVNPPIAIATFGIFTTVGMMLYFRVNKRVNRLGNENAELTILSNEKIFEALTNYRELYVRDRRNHYTESINNFRQSMAWNSAELSFIPNLGKYLIETTMVVGAIVICAFQFHFSDATHAVSILSIFLAAGTRIAPAILRVQSGAIAIKGGYGGAKITLDLIAELEELKATDNMREILSGSIESNFRGVIDFRGVDFIFPDSSKAILNKINFRIDEGETVAIVGPSGAGKSTLIDVMLGLYSPNSGSIRISGHEPQVTIKKWPGSIAYVPQEVFLTNATIRENIAIGYSHGEIDNDRILKALSIAQLDEYVFDLADGVDTLIGEHGIRMSGGQTQRIGIARALYTDPKVLVMDEATSSLDGKTELDLSNALLSLKGKITVVLIAHRLSTVRAADKVVYLDQGKILSSGTFDEVKAEIPEFALQAKLLGL